MSANDKPSNRVITPKAILSYPHLFSPQAPPGGGKAKYSACLIFEKGTDLSALKKAVLDAAVTKWGADKAPGMIRAGQLRLPFREDWEAKGYPEGAVFLNVRTEQQPGIVSIYPGPDKKPLPITEEKEIYPGCYVRASINPFAYDTQGNKGVSFALNNIQKLADGPRLDNRRAAEDEFEADMSAAPADLSDLM